MQTLNIKKMIDIAETVAKSAATKLLQKVESLKQVDCEFSRDVYLWNTKNHIDGEYTLSAQALDGSGNEGFSSPVLVSIENSK